MYKCVSVITETVVDESRCDPTLKPSGPEEPCNLQPCPAFWSASPWSPCSLSCGGGRQHRQVLCRQGYANRTVAVHPHRCRNLQRPNSTRGCPNTPCTHWEITSEWQSCSVPCGRGQRSRGVRCVGGADETLGETDCSDSKPPDNEECDMGPCVSGWFYSEWGSKCSVDCGLGVQRRSVLCLAADVQHTSTGQCAAPRPPDVRTCARDPCPPRAGWFSGPWTQCGVDCGEGTQVRDVLCVVREGGVSTVTDPSHCVAGKKPPTLQTCRAPACPPRWLSSAWTQCSRSCGGGEQSRGVRCGDEVGDVSSGCDDAARPSQQRSCNTHPCSAQLDAGCRDTSHNCGVVVQARLCVYSYYRTVCCASCTLSQRRRAARA